MKDLKSGATRISLHEYRRCAAARADSVLQALFSQTRIYPYG